MKKHFYIILFSVGFLACTRSVPQEMKRSIKLNQSASSLLEWETSEDNPKNIFQRHREEFKTNPELGSEVCRALSQLKEQDLVLFEEEINNPANESLLKDCRSSLKKKLESYWLEQKKILHPSSLNFSFPVRTEKRDLTKGYRAATGDVQPKELILTFDDGPHPTRTSQVLDILKSVNAKAMFFTLGQNVRANPSLVQREAQEEHIIGSHSITHRCLANTANCIKANGGKALTFDEAVAEIRGGHQAVYDALGFVDPFFRFPYGETSPELVSFLAEKQVAQFHWYIDSEDWRNRSNQELLQSTLAQVDKKQRGIILFHDIQRRTVEILPDFLKAIYDRGYSLVILQSADEKERFNSQLVTKHRETY
ncbi:MAG: polysaccharide deacetylase family protein [Pseudobdellovibrionaceae bacterium]